MSLICISGFSSALVKVVHDEFEKMFHMPITIGDSAKATPVSFPSQGVDVDWIISETDK